MEAASLRQLWWKDLSKSHSRIASDLFQKHLGLQPSTQLLSWVAPRSTGYSSVNEPVLNIDWSHGKLTSPPVSQPTSSFSNPVFSVGDTCQSN